MSATGGQAAVWNWGASGKGGADVNIHLVENYSLLLSCVLRQAACSGGSARHESFWQRNQGLILLGCLSLPQARDGFSGTWYRNNRAWIQVPVTVLCSKAIPLRPLVRRLHTCAPTALLNALLAPAFLVPLLLRVLAVVLPGLMNHSLAQVAQLPV